MNKKIKYGSVCSGVECATVALRDLGWELVFVSEVEPFPCAVLQQKFNCTPPIHPLDPDEAKNESEKKERLYWKKIIDKMPNKGEIPNEGDFSKIGNKYLGKYDCLIGGTPCLNKDWMVLTEYGFKPIYEISVGERVFTHKGRLKKVLKIGHKPSKVGEIYIEGFPILGKTTFDHHFLGTENFSENKYFEAKDFKNKNVISYSGKADIQIPEIPNYISNKELFHLIGWYLNSGLINDNKELVINTETSFLDKFKYQFNNKDFYFENNNQIVIKHQDLISWINLWFGNNQNKKIPAWCYALDESMKKEIIYGYINSSNIDFIKTKSKSLAFGLSMLSNFSSIEKSNDKDEYYIYPNNNAEIKNNEYSYRLCKDYKCYEDIEEVFNLEVEDDHSYIANGIISSNCQSFSVAGKREGLEGASGLALEYIKFAYESRVRWIVWENVPGVFSSNNGRDFASFLSGLTGCKINPPKDGWRTAGIIPNIRKDRYGIAWRVLDTQYVRVDGFPNALPQRRLRVFVVGYFGDWKCAAKVLFERSCLHRDSPPERSSAKKIADRIRKCSNRTIRKQKYNEGNSFDGKEKLCEEQCERISECNSDGSFLNNYVIYDSKGNINNGVISTITGDHESRVNHYSHLVHELNNNEISIAIAENIIGRKIDNGGNGFGIQKDVAYTQNATGVMGIYSNRDNKNKVRRLTPIECERLMGLPDNHTKIEWNNKNIEDCPDIPRYKACGNGFGVNVIRWIGKRIQMVEDSLKNSN